MIVVDAGVITAALSDDTVRGEEARSRLRDKDLAAPELVDIEVASALRGLVRGGRLDARLAMLALMDLRKMTLTRVPHAPLLARCWELRDNLTAYDASYVALAELFDVVLLTRDRRLAEAPGLRCRVEVLR